jgi:hypothetical protein
METSSFTGPSQDLQVKSITVAISAIALGLLEQDSTPVRTLTTTATLIAVQLVTIERLTLKAISLKNPKTLNERVSKLSLKI